MAINLFSSSESTVQVGDEVVEGVQSIDYKVNRNMSYVYSFNSHLRTGVNYGNKVVTGTIKVKSASNKLDSLVHKADYANPVNIVVSLKKGETTKALTFTNVFIEDRTFSMDVNGVGLSVYTFNAEDIQGES